MSQWETYDWLVTAQDKAWTEAHVATLEAKYGWDLDVADVRPIRWVQSVGAMLTMQQGSDWTAANKAALDLFGIEDLGAAYDQLRNRQLDWLRASPAAQSEAAFANMGGDVGRVGMSDPDRPKSNNLLVLAGLAALVWLGVKRG